MAKTRAELNAAADARARAAGFTSRSQMHRAKKVGYADKAPEYRAAVEQRRTGRLVKTKTTGRLLGLVSSQSGTVISADLSKGQGAALWRELQRYAPTRRCTVTIETDEGRVIEVGGNGGMRLGYLRNMRGEMSGKRTRKSAPRWGHARIVTVTVA
jgi:hypothetical protein